MTFPEFTINHVIPFAVDSSTGVTVTQGNVYSYNGRYYVCIATVLTNTDFKYENSTAPYFQNGSGIPVGTIHKTSDGKVYILKAAYGNGWCALPSSNSNWVLINQ